MPKNEITNVEKQLEKAFGQFGVPNSDTSVTTEISAYDFKAGKVAVVSYKTGAILRGEKHATPTPECTDTYLYDIFGKSRTDQTGKVIFQLRYYMCEGVLAGPVFVTATANSDTCAIMTTRGKVDSSGINVSIEAESWAPDGSPQPFTSFNFSCRVTYRSDR